MNNRFRFTSVCFSALLCFWPMSAFSQSAFIDGFEDGEINEELWQIDAYGQCQIDIVKEPVRSGEHSIAFDSSGRDRCEIVPHTIQGTFAALKRKFIREPFGRDRWYAFSSYLVGPWEPHDKDMVLAQWHSSPDRFIDKKFRGPPLAIRVIGGYLRISFGWDSEFRSTRAPIAVNTMWYAPIETDAWLDWVIRAQWSYESDGIIQIWKDGELIVDYVGPNLYNDLRGVYLKLGVYHPGVNRKAYLDDIFIGDQAPDPKPVSQP